jgi:hypothetical protein
MPDVMFISCSNALAAAQTEKKPDSEQSAEDILNRGFSTGADTFGKEEGRRFGFPTAPMQNYLFHECRTLVKTVVCAVKTISWGIASCKPKVRKLSWNEEFGSTADSKSVIFMVIF